MNKIKDFIKKETVLSIALVLAIVSSFFVKPSIEYISYIDWRVLGILLSLMLVMEGFKEDGVFRLIGQTLIGYCRNARQLGLVLVFLCFFFSMFLTNDVALITFVPFAILTLNIAKQEKMILPIVVFQTIAANLGSMLTPMGNPQNIYLHGLSGMTTVEFLKITLPFVAVSGICLFICNMKMKRDPIAHGDIEMIRVKKVHVLLYTALFIFCVLTVVKIIPWYIVLIFIVIITLILNRNLMARADYSLLLTFIGFFIFIGNMGNIGPVRDLLSQIITGHEFAISVISSQAISNVPAAILLSGFTDNYKDLIIGVNVGGLGTLIASMASLISYKQIANAYPDKKGKYFRLFTVMNLVFLGILVLLNLVINR